LEIVSLYSFQRNMDDLPKLLIIFIEVVFSCPYSFDPDARTRHTMWTSVIGGYFFWLPPFASTQIQVQRFLSIPMISRVRR